jgi:hypothetical protein
MAMKAEIGGFLRKFEAIKDYAVELGKQEFPDTWLTRNLLERYNDTMEQFWGMRDILKIKYLQPEHIYEKVDSFNAKPVLKSIEIECEGVIGVLEHIVIPLPKEELDKLSSLRKELEDLSTDLPTVYFERNIEEAVKECEQGHFLASALISGRVIAYTLEQIPGKTLQDKVKALQEKGVIDKERKVVQEAVVKADKLARNFFSHDINVTPSPSDALSLLSGAVNMLKLYRRFCSSSTQAQE